MAGGSDCDPPLSSPTAHLGLGKLYRRTDKREQAQEHLTTATTWAWSTGWSRPRPRWESGA